jgi:pimeloyl-ACP methyl ester carboxylesterase
MRTNSTLAALGLAALLALTGGCAREIEAIRVLQDISAGAGPSSLKRHTDAPRREAIAYRAGGRDYLADLYRPGGGEKARAALVLVPGVAPAGRDDPRLVAFANTLARARFAVLVPDMPNLKAQRITAADIRHIGDAASYLAERKGPRGPRPLGIAAISYAVGPALMAALAAAPGRVSFVVGIGGYHDSLQVITFFTTGNYRQRDETPWRHAEPNAFGKWVFVLGNAHRIEDAHDRALLRAMARRKLDDRGAPIGDLAGALGPEGASVHALVVNTSPERVPALVALLPAGVRREIEALDPSRRDLRSMGTRLILVHGRDDAIVPFTESQRLAAAARPGKARLYLVDNLMHADMAAPGIWDAFTLWRAVRSLLRERDGVAD